MIITKTPVRTSFLGGGTDYPEYFREHGGQTLGAAINKYSYIIVNEMADLFDYNIRLSYSKMELVKQAEELKHPSVRACLQFLNIERNVEIHYLGDLPARTGLGSSSSFTVGLLHALHALKGEMVSRQQLAEEAVYVEQEIIKERVGVQDQYICAHGGLVNLKFNQDGHIKVRPVPLREKRMNDFQNHLMLFYTGISRLAHEVLEEQIERTKQGAITKDLSQLSTLVDDGIKTLSSEEPISFFGELLHQAWETKRKLSQKISNPEIDGLYERARKVGAVGGKLLGAGGGGFLLFVVPPEKRKDVINELKELKEVSFAFDHVGSSLLFYNPTKR
jgi:D-glycero-alpha-D-manno-heptose-7-phosphate kinase